MATKNWITSRSDAGEVAIYELATFHEAAALIVCLALLISPWLAAGLVASFVRGGAVIGAGVVITAYTVLLFVGRFDIRRSLQSFLEWGERQRQLVPATWQHEGARWESSATDRGIAFTADGVSLVLEWTSIRRVEASPVGLFVSADVGAGRVLLFIPARAYADASSGEFLECVRRRVKRLGSPGGLALGDAGAGVPRHRWLHWRVRGFLWVAGIYVCWAAWPGFSRWLPGPLSSLVLFCRHLVGGF